MSIVALKKKGVILFGSNVSGNKPVGGIWLRQGPFGPNATINLDNQDPEINVNVAKNIPFKLADNAKFALNNSFGFGGHNVCIAFSKI